MKQLKENTIKEKKQKKKNTCKCAGKLSPMDSGVYVNVVHNLGLKLKSLSAFVSPYMHSTITKLHLFNLFVPYFGSIKMSVFSLH